MKRDLQAGIGLAGLITLLLIFVIVAFGAGWLAKHYYANHLFLVQTDAADFPAVLKMQSRPGALSWNDQQLVFANQASSQGVVRITPLENNQYSKAAYPVVENEQLNPVKLQGITWNGTKFIAIADGSSLHSEHQKVFIELDPGTFQITRLISKAPEFAQCIVWDGMNYWAGTYQPTTAGNGHAPLYKLDADLKPVAEFEGAGRQCTGLAWDGKYLWWVEQATATLYLFDIFNSSSKPPSIVHQYRLQIDQPGGISFDGKDIWLSDSGQQALMRLNQDLYFDWLGGHFEITGPDQLDQFGGPASHLSSPDINGLAQPLLNRQIQEKEILAYIDTLLGRYSNDEIRQVLKTAREKIADTRNLSVLNKALQNLVDSGEIDYQDKAPVADAVLKVEYFRGVIDQGDLLASWKIVAGSEILSGVDAPRPQQLPDSYDFTTYIRYRVRVTDIQSGDEQEYDFDVFGDSDEQEDFSLLEQIQAGEYRVTIDMMAQFYTDNRANRYEGKFEMKVLY